MNNNIKRRKIITISTLILCFLLLLGITYAYFVTKIKGNTNTNSVKLTTAELEIEYNDGNSNISINEMKPGEEIAEKTFSVTNTKDSKVDNYSVYIEILENTLERKDDLTYSLSCKTYRTSNNELIGDCDGVDNVTFPSNNDLAVINSIDVGTRQDYVLKLKYNETHTNQSVDMNKSIVSKIQIYDLNNFNVETLSYKATNSANKGLHETLFQKTLVNKPGVSTNNSTDKYMSISKDDYGTSFYFYGNVNNNYVSFNNMCWRILRINGDGTTKLILADSSATCSSSTISKTTSAFINSSNYNLLNNSNYNDSALKTTLEGWYTQSFVDTTIKNKINNYYWCNDLTIYSNSDMTYYSNYKRLSLTNTNLSSPSLKCLGNKAQSYVGTITSDEVVFTGAGGNDLDKAIPSYLVNNANGTYWTMSPSSSSSTDSNIYQVYQNGAFTSSSSKTSAYIRPMIVLNKNVTATGSGTIENPYIIE